MLGISRPVEIVSSCADHLVFTSALSARSDNIASTFVLVHESMSSCLKVHATPHIIVQVPVRVVIVDLFTEADYIFWAYFESPTVCSYNKNEYLLG